MGVIKLDISGNPFVGVWCSANDNIAIVPPALNKSNIRKIERALNVQVVPCSVAGTNLIGTLLAMNSHGAIVTNFIEENEKITLEKYLRIGVLEQKLNAAGNLILANDNAALIHPGLDDDCIKLIAEVLEVEVESGTIANLKTVGAVAVVTNKGLLCHPKVTAEERQMMEQLFSVPIEIGTANYGTPLIGACVIANKHGAITGFTSTGIELGRIETGLNLL